ncbi:serine hydrolase domain-containing protein [Roseivirga sp. BDSF3-8]|uniref:serine hydrolase domain-containing protein n=1 Tax=Roseivirga sp. BDSF3-8 TaxID=3241598 RepID=UPI0035324E30
MNLLASLVISLSSFIISYNFPFVLAMTAFGEDETEAGKSESFYAEFHPEPLKITNDHTAYGEMEGFDYEVERFMKRWGVKGASVAVVRDSELLYTKGYGFANEENGEVTQPSHKFRIASVSKLVTAVAIMKLVEDQKLRLDQQVFGADGVLNDSIYLNYRDNKVEKITVSHLLTHSAGWSSRAGDPMFMDQVVAQWADKPLPLDVSDYIEYALNRRLSFYPGTRSIYSNLGFVVLGEVIAKASGMDYETYVQTNVLYPLGIYDMTLGHSLMDEIQEGEVTYYDKQNAAHRLSCFGTGDMVPRTYGGTHIEALGAAGGWVASVTDLMRLLTAIDGWDEREDILSPESIKTMTEPDPTYLSPMGWRSVNGLGRWWRTGTLAGTSAIMVRRADGISYVMITNTSTWKGSRFSRELDLTVTRALNRVNEWPETDLFEHETIPSLIPMPMQPVASAN